MEMDDVLLASSASGRSTLHTSEKILRLTSSRSVADSITRSHSARSSSALRWRCASARLRSSSLTVPLELLGHVAVMVARPERTRSGS